MSAANLTNTAERLRVINLSDAICPCGADPKDDPNAHKVESGWIMEVVPYLYGEDEDDAYEARVTCPPCAEREGEDTEAHEARDMRGLPQDEEEN